MDAAAFRSALHGLRQKILNGESSSGQLRAQLNVLLQDASAHRDEPAYVDAANDVAAATVALLVRDSMAFRVSILGELACGIAEWTRGADGLIAIITSASRSMQLDDYESALGFLDRLDAAEPDCQDFVGRVIETLRVRCLKQVGRLEAADSIVTRFEAVVDACPDDQVTVHLLLAGAFAAWALGRNQSALTRAERASSICERMSSSDMTPSWLPGALPPLSSARVANAYGVFVRRAGEPLRAIEIFQSARAKAIRDGDAYAAALCLSEVGITWERMGEFERGARVLCAAADEMQAYGDMETAARWRKIEVVEGEGRRRLTGFDGLAAVGARLNASQEPDDDAEALVKAIIKEAEPTERELEMNARNVLAECYCRRRQFNRGITQLHVAINIADQIGDRWMAMILRCNLANLFFRANRFAGAEDAATDAHDRALAIWHDATNSEVRQAAIAAAAGAAEVLFLMWAHEVQEVSGNPRLPNADRVAGLAQQVKSRNFNRWLTLTTTSPQAHTDDIRKAARALIEAEVAVEASALSGLALDVPMKTLALAKQSFARYALAPEASPLVDRTSALHLATKALPSGAIVLDLNPIESGIVTVLSGADGPGEVFTLPWTRPERAAWMAKWRGVCGGDSQRAGWTRSRRRSGAPELPTVTDVTDGLSAAVEELDARFCEPLFCRLAHTTTRLICATHAELFGIPVWALARFAPRMSVSIVPSLASISLLAGRPSSGTSRRVAAGDATGTLEMVVRELDMLPGFVRLEPNRDDLAKGLAGARFVHFAGHGDFIEANPYESGLVLRGTPCSPYAVVDEQDGCVRLTLLGLIHDWQVADCELVVLSACSTGIPRAHQASELTSVATALLLAGARNVIAASWPADDVAAAVQMGEFYAALERLGSPSRALAQARSVLASMDRATAAARIGGEHDLPPGDRPFASPIYTDTFVHFGID